jgi:hypothetical protein
MPDCDCDASNKMSDIVSGGYNTKEQTLEELRVYFKAGVDCIHSR